MYVCACLVVTINIMRLLELRLAWLKATSKGHIVRIKLSTVVVACEISLLTVAPVVIKFLWDILSSSKDGWRHVWMMKLSLEIIYINSSSACSHIYTMTKIHFSLLTYEVKRGSFICYQIYISGYIPFKLTQQKSLKVAGR